MSSEQTDRAADQANTPIATTSEDSPEPVQEYDGPQGLEPTRFGDWERKGRCFDF